MRGPRVGWGAVLAAATLVASGERTGAEPPAKETPAEWVASLTAAVEKGPIQDVADLVEEKKHKFDFPGVAAIPDPAVALLRAIHDHAPWRSVESQQTAKVLVFVAVEVSKAMAHSAPADLRTQRAIALAHATKGRLLAARGESLPVEDWLAAGELAAKSYEDEAGAKDGGEFAHLAIGWMRAAAALPGADAAAVGKRAEALGSVFERLPAGPYVVAGKATVKLIALDAVLRATPPPAPPALKAPLDEIVATLAPLARPGGDLAASTLWQECVTIARGRKVPSVKIDYVLRPPVPGLNVTWQLPYSSEWHDVPFVVGQDAPFTGSFEQRTSDGRALHRIDVYTFRWDKSYLLAQIPFKGDSPKELAVADMTFRKATVFAKVAAEKPPVRGTLSEGMGSALVYELEGTSTRGSQPLAVRAFVVRGRDTKGTFLVVATTTGNAPPGDPELDAVLKSFREVKGSK